MAKKSKKTIEYVNNQDEKLDDLDRSILNIAKCNPEYNTNQIGNELIKIDKIRSVDTVYKRLSKNTYLRGEINRLRELIKEDHTRVVFPLARKELEKALKDKGMHIRDKTPLIKLAYDKELSTKEESTNTFNQQINVESIRMIIQNAIER